MAARARWWHARENPPGALGLLMLLVVLAAALLAPWIAPYERAAPAVLSMDDVYAPPDASRWLGTDDGGRAVLTGFVHGARVSLLVGFFAAFISVVAGTAVGLLAAFWGGRRENALMRLTDIVLVIPDLPLIIALVALLGPSLLNIILVIGLVGWTGTARLVRAQTLKVKQRTFVRRARVLGAGPWRIITRHLLPHLLPLVLVNAVLVLSLAILNESTLSFLGLADPAAPSWGQMLHFAFTRGAMSAGAWWTLVPPGLGIAWVVLGCTLLGHGLEQHFDPRPRTHHLSAQAQPQQSPPPASSSEEGTEALLEVRDLSIEYGSGSGSPARVVDGVSFALHPGEILGVVGESGCGKTSLLLGLLRLLPAGGRIASGRIQLRGRDLMGLDERQMAAVRWKEISLVFQGAMNAFNPVRSVGSQIEEAILVHEPGTGAEALRLRVGELLERVGLDPGRRDQYPHQYSGGMRQRAMVAMALACNPRIVCADEPTTALDAIVQAQILDLLDDLRRQLGLAIVLVSHDLGAVAQICDRALVMYAGGVAECGSAEAVFTRPRHPYTQELLRAFPDLAPRDAPLASIPGAPPPPDALPPGCPFAPRCPKVLARCHGERPREWVAGPGHGARCHLLEAAP